MLAAALACSVLCALQVPRGLAEDHMLCVRTERTGALLEVLAGVAAERRAAILAGLLARRPAGVGAAAGVSLQDLARATRAAQDRPWTALQSLADSLDLSLVPGLFGARTEGPGEALTIRVHALWDGAQAPDFTLELAWVSPAGERVLARREPVDAEFVPGAGFEMYVRPPLSEPGTWLLEPCVEIGDERACGVSLSVACVADFGGRLGAARAFATEGQIPGSLLLRALDRLQRFGARTSAALGPPEMLALLEGSAPGSLPRPSLLLGGDTDATGATGEHGTWVWSLRPAGEIERAVCLLVAEGETADALFAGVLGARWASFAEEHHALLFAARLPRGAAGGGARGLLERLALETCGDGAAPLPLFVVARAETSGVLQLALGEGQSYPFDGLVISAVVRRPTAATVFPGVPRLLLSPGAVAEEAAGFFVAPGAELTLFNELDLPARMGAWLMR